uniref:ARAD1C26268p n=1 Tax=Blastobotrys adeninivorans TaxID=409370 RepID=A0A060T771_BLAAD
MNGPYTSRRPRLSRHKRNVLFGSDPSSTVGNTTANVDAHNRSANATTNTTANATANMTASATSASSGSPSSFDRDSGGGDSHLQYLFLIFLVLGVALLALIARRFIHKRAQRRRQHKHDLIRAQALRRDLETASRRSQSTPYGRPEPEEDGWVPPPPAYHETISAESAPVYSYPAIPQQAHVHGNGLPGYHD